MESNARFKTPISLRSVATITVAALLFTILVMNHERMNVGLEALFLFALIFFGPVSIVFLEVVNSGWSIVIKVLLLITVTPMIFAVTFWRSRYRHFETSFLFLVGTFQSDAGRLFYLTRSNLRLKTDVESARHKGSLVRHGLAASR
jgi:hypothetical protein